MALNLSTLTSPSTSDDVLSDLYTTADQGDGIALMNDLSANDIDATQTTALYQPIAYDAANGGPFARFDGSNDHMSFTLASPITNGTVFFAAKKGSYAANLDLAAGRHDFSGNKISNQYYYFANDLVALLLFDFALSQSQIDQLKAYFVTKGAVEDYGAVTSFNNAWIGCPSLTSFPLIDTSSGTNFVNAWQSCNSLTSFPSIVTSLGIRFDNTWRFCLNLQDFPAGFFDNWNPTSINNGAFNNTWDSCPSLTSQSVENILVSIDTSGKYATNDGTSSGTELADDGIDIDYDGSGLTANTDTAIANLFFKSWEVFINSVLKLPFAPVFAYEAEFSMLAAGGSAAAQGDLIATLDDRSENSVDATQTTASYQPVAYVDSVDGTFAQFDGSDDRMSFTLADPITNGTVFFATKKGSYAANLDLPASTYNFSGNKISNNYEFSNDLVSLLLFDFALSQSQIDQLKAYFVTKGAVEDYGAITNFYSAFRNCSSLTSFPLIDTSSGTTFSFAWYNCSSLTSFPLIDTSSGTSFGYAWFGCSSLTSFPLIDTSSGNNFSRAWQNCTSLTSFPLIDMPSGTNFFATWYGCTNLTSFPLINTSSGTFFGYAWFNCPSLEDFPAGFFDNWNPSSIANGVFDATWDGCPSLTSQSVENILTSIDTSGKYASDDGTSGGTELADVGIDIDYDGSGLTAATTTAIDSLSGKGWQVYINGELVIPNILDLEPAAAYSLRSFDANADPNVVNVRRSSDNATSDFTASEVSDGTLRDWTLGDTLALDGQRMYFDGVDDYVDLNQSLIPATGDFSISLKYAHEEQAASYRYILSQGNSINTFFGLSIYNDTVTCFVEGANAGSVVATSISKGSVYEFKVTRVGDVFTLYVDGVSVGTQTNVGLTISTNTNTYIGQATWTSGRFTKGTAYDIKKDGAIYYKGYGNTNADWTDQVGSNDATVYGSPALYSGQGFDGYVTTWYDQSSNGRDSSQATASAQPKIVDGGSLTTNDNGNPAIDFDGVNHVLVMNESSNPFDSDGDLSAFIYCDYSTTAVGGQAYVFKFGSSTRGTRFGRAYNANISVTVNDEVPNTAIVSTASAPTGDNLFSFALDRSANLSFYQNGALVGTDDATVLTGDIDVSPKVIGAATNGSNYGAPITELIIYPSDQSANRTGIENNINDHFNIYS